MSLILQRPIQPENTSRERSPGLDVTTITQGGIREAHLTLSLLSGETFEAMLSRLVRVLCDLQVAAVRQEIFGPVSAWEDCIASLQRSFGDIAWPVIWMGGDSAAITGMHVMAVGDTEIRPVRVDGDLVGCRYRDAHATHCLLGGLAPRAVNRSKASQTQEVFERFEAALTEADLKLEDVARTWLVLDGILSWYPTFNDVRTKFFAGHTLPFMPASTGVGSRNPRGAALTLGAWATRSLTPQFHVSEVPSPLQCSAENYGSSFSRAVEMISPDCHRLLISGTASIEANGRTGRKGNARGQIDLTMQVVSAILSSRKMSFADATRATVYLRDAADAPAFAKWCARHHNEFLPAVITQAHVCRDDLLFEIEMDAISHKPRSHRSAPQRAGEVAK